jgi:hypothetical protein
MPRINSSWYTITIILQFPSAVHKDSTLIKIWELSLTCLGLYLKKSTEDLTLCVQRKGIFGRKHDFSCYQKWNNKGDTRYRYLGYKTSYLTLRWYYEILIIIIIKPHKFTCRGAYR